MSISRRQARFLAATHDMLRKRSRRLARSQSNRCRCPRRYSGATSSLDRGCKNRAEEWRREITEADVGAIFKDKRILSEGIGEWKGRQALDSITRIRWGGRTAFSQRHSHRNDYSIDYGNGSNYASIELRKEAIYSNALIAWPEAVGVRLLTKLPEGLRDGKKPSLQLLRL